MRTSNVGYAPIDCCGRQLRAKDTVRIVGLPLPRRIPALSRNRDLVACKRVVGRYRVIVEFDAVGLVGVRINRHSDGLLYLEPDLVRLRQSTTSAQSPRVSDAVALHLARAYLSERGDGSSRRWDLMVLESHPQVVILGRRLRHHGSTKNLLGAVYGNGPLLIDRRTRAVLPLSSAEPHERQVRRYLACGHPNPDDLEPDTVLRSLRQSRRRWREGRGISG